MADLDPLSLDFASRYPDAFARVLGRGEAKECAEIVEHLPDRQKAAIVARLPVAQIEELLGAEPQAPVEWLADAPFDDAVTLLSRIPRARRLDLINAVSDAGRRRDLLRHQQYPVHSVGALVRDVPMRISAQTNAADALAELRELESDDPGPLVVVDADGRYRGIVDRWRLLMGNPPAGTVDDYVIDVKPLRPETPIAVAATSEEWHTRNWLPVIDHKQRVLGGVSRASVFTAQQGRISGTGGRSDLLLEVLDDLASAFGTLLDRVLAPRGSK